MGPRHPITKLVDDKKEGSVLRFLAGLALVPYAMRGLGSLLILGLVGIAVVCALLLLLLA
jgi:hypothetical protein